MAAARKRSTGSRNTSAKTSSSRKKNTKTQAKRGATEHTSSSVESEITLWIVLTISIVLLVSNFGVGGAVGNAISSFFFGLVGLICYPLPIFLFLGVAFVISNSRNPRAYRKMVGFLLLFIAMCMFMQLLTEGAVYEDSILTYYQVSAEYKTGGGILGGLLCRLCVQAFGTVGTYAITVAAIMISLVLITQKSMFDMIRKCSRWAYRHAAQSRARRIEAARIRQEQAEALQAEAEEEHSSRRKERREEKQQQPHHQKQGREIPTFFTAEPPKEEPAKENPVDELFVPEKAFPIQRADHLVQDIEEIAVLEDGVEDTAEEILAKEQKSEKTEGSF